MRLQAWARWSLLSEPPKNDLFWQCTANTAVSRTFFVSVLLRPLMVLVPRLIDRGI